MVIPYTLSVDTDKAWPAEAALLALAPIAMPVLVWTGLIASTSTIRVCLIPTVTPLAVVISDTFPTDANKPIFAETAFLAATLAVGLMGITHLIAVSAALLVYLVLVTLLFALPVRNTLATDAYKALFAEATLLAGL